MTMTSNEIKKEIVMNLKNNHPGKWVSPAVAIKSLDPVAFTALNELIEEKIIDQKHLHLDGQNAPLVRYVDRHVKPTLTLIQGGKQ
jgi:hypothetical protein